ncbi:hypothetical protein [Sphingomonas sp. PP-CC-3A-396]|uniref:hypothetical protein n=1 Tax=Sphingomonas sp. PP-CC-3A-396 TaxID=2135655 RepID=UPI00104D8B82|nr:hypothetical protein [Sphingomonas sp. PP-CC-3A-396]TCQ04090.1 hypothetical protein C8J40_109225 [Sphingomonas sp. PP-CC-3A-396]
MTEFASIGLMAVVIAIGSAVLLWGIDLCCRHEMFMLDQGARDRKSDGLRGGAEGVAVHEKGNAR